MGFINFAFVAIVVWSIWFAIRRHQLFKQEEIIQILASLALIIGLFPLPMINGIYLSDIISDTGWTFLVIGWIVGSVERHHYFSQNARNRK